MISKGIALMDNCRDFSTVSEVASVSVNVWVALLVAVGVPLMPPSSELSVRPSGRPGELALRPHL